jgi:hypothetical protein
MPQLAQFPSVFPIWWIALTASVGVLASLAAIVIRGHITKSAQLSRGRTVVVALIVGLSIFVWRLSGNIPELNDDPAGVLSPNDWLCPVITYVFLGLYAAMWPAANIPSWAKTRALLTVVSFAVNVVTI